MSAYDVFERARAAGLAVVVRPHPQNGARCTMARTPFHDVRVPLVNPADLDWLLVEMRNTGHQVLDEPPAAEEPETLGGVALPPGWTVKAA